MNGNHSPQLNTAKLVAMITTIVGTLKQDGYGNVRRHDALAMGLATR